MLAATLAATLLASAQPNELFQKAGRAYDAGHFADAVTNYTALLQQGYRSSEVYFNLGNAEFRSGHGGAAVLAYRRAWHLAPRDADIAANLQFAWEQTGVVPPATSTAEHMLQSLSAQEWRWVTLAAFWLLAAAASLWLLLPSRRKGLRSLVLLSSLSLGVALYGVWYWLDLQTRQPEAVVMQPTKVLFAPLPNATEYFALPAGSLVRIEAQDGAWWRIRSGTRSGWLPQTSSVPVCAKTSE